MRAILFGIIFMSFLQTIRAQDPVFSQAIWNDLQLNPALAGTHKHDNRLFGIYRDQWRQAPVPYATANFTYDRKLLLNGGEKHRLGLGGQFLYDKAGTAALSQINLEGILSYTLLLNSMKQRISVGVGAGINNRSIDGSKLIFGPDGNNSGGEVFASDNWLTPRISTGINFYSELKKAGNVDLGISLFNPHQPEGTFFNTPSQQLSRLSAYTRFNFNLAQNWILQPGFVFNQQGEFQQGTNTLLARYQIKDIGLWFGPGYRWGDAVIGYIGIEVADIRAGFSYDQNLSDFRQATNGIGAFELSLTYAWTKKKPDPEEFDFTPPIAEEEEVEEEEEVIAEENPVVEEEKIVVERIEVVREESPVAVPPANTYANLLGQKITFYFDNNTPTPGKAVNYKDLYEQYLSRQPEFEKAYPEAANFFNNQLKAEKEKFDQLAGNLMKALDAGKSITVSMKGFASNVGPAAYNQQLSSNRIGSVKEYLLLFKDGALKTFVESGKLVFNEVPLGATQSVLPGGADKKTVLFSPLAAQDRRVEMVIEEVK